MLTTEAATGRSFILTPHVARAILAHSKAALRAMEEHIGREGGRGREIVAS